jgi:hypothetical protein
VILASRRSKASARPANLLHLVQTASAVHALHARPTAALNVAKAVVRQAAAAAIAVLQPVAERQWQTVLLIPSARPSLRRRNARASSWSTRTHHRASAAARQPVRASVRVSVVANLSNR